MPSEDPPGSDPVADLADRLAATGYVADRPLAMVLYLAQQLQSPILLEGEPGVGKTSVAESLAEITGARLVRLQCYEGLAAHHAIYEWDYTRQLLSIRRCLYHWIPFPALDREIAILQARLPDASTLLVQQTCLFVERLRAGYYRKAPGISETLDWLRALTLLGESEITPTRVAETIGVLLKDSEDIRVFTEKDHERVYREYGMRVTS